MRSAITTFVSDQPRPRSHSSVSNISSVETSRCEISMLSPTKFAQTTRFVITSPRSFSAMRPRFQKRPLRSGIAATEWLPEVTHMMRPSRPSMRASLQRMTTGARSGRSFQTSRSKMKVSVPQS